MAGEHRVVGLDIGTHYIKASLLSTKDENTLFGAVVESSGVTRDGISDTKAVGESIRKAIRILETKASSDLSSVYVNIPSEYCRLADSRGESAIKNGNVDESDIDRAIDMAQLIPLQPEEEIVDIIIPKYYIDEIPYRNPIGVKGSLLEIRAQVVIAGREYVESVYEACAYARTRVIGTGLSSESAASLLLGRSDKENGVFLVDTGAYSTRVVLYKGDRLFVPKVIPLGGRNITKDLSIVMGMSLLEAEEFKKSLGSGKLDQSDDRKALAVEVVKARIDEIISIAKKEMESYEGGEQVDKAVFYGGGLCGFDDIKNLSEIKPKKSTNFITSDIIKNNGILTVQASGIAYNVLNTIHYRKLLDNETAGDESQLSRTSGEYLTDEEFFERHKHDFKKTSGYVKTHAEEPAKGNEEFDQDDYEEEKVSIFNKIRNIFGR
jgi:cell division protein FtsA